MKRIILFVALLFLIAGQLGAADEVAFPTFKSQEIDASFTVGYALVCVDVNGDKKLDVVVVDSQRVVWYENPTWKRRNIIVGKTKPDNVCISAADIDRDGKVDLALGAEWKPFNTKSGGTIQWLRQPKSLDEEWTIHEIDSEPTVHRIRFADVLGKGEPQLLSVPLMGRDSTKEGNWLDGRPVRVVAYEIPKDPTKDKWTAQVLDDQHIHCSHNFHAVPTTNGRKGLDVLTASAEGLGVITQKDGKWLWTRIGAGNQDTPKGNRGCSEVKQGKLKNGQTLIGTVEPWHGNQIVVYTPPAADATNGLWNRHVVDDQLVWGHAVWFADLDGDGNDELISGVRDDPKKDDKNKLRRGIRIYKATDDKGAKWARAIVDEGGMSCEDAAAADLDGDGKIDIVACGRFTKNLIIYWNQGVKK